MVYQIPREELDDLLAYGYQAVAQTLAGLSPAEKVLITGWVHVISSNLLSETVAIDEEALRPVVKAAVLRNRQLFEEHLESSEWQEGYETEPAIVKWAQVFGIAIAMDYVH